MQLNYLIPGCLLLLLAACQNDRDNISDNLSKTAELTEDSNIIANHLFSASEINDLISSDPDMVIFEVSSASAYDEGHIPGAFHLNRSDFATRNQGPISGVRATPIEIERLLSRFGVKPQSKILLYDDSANVEVLRLLWILKMYGHENLMIINGAKKAWIDGGYALETKKNRPPQTQSDYKFSDTPDLSLLAEYEDVRLARYDTNTIIVDTREPYEYLGQAFIKDGEIHHFKKGAFREGRIAGAKHYNWSSAVDLKDDHKFKSKMDLEYDLDQAGIKKDKNIIVYCQSGTRSAHTYYVLKELLGYSSVRNYDGSWIEWSYYQMNKEQQEVESLSEERKQSIIDSLQNLIKKTDE